MIQWPAGQKFICVVRETVHNFNNGGHTPTCYATEKKKKLQSFFIINMFRQKLIEVGVIVAFCKAWLKQETKFSVSWWT